MLPFVVENILIVTSAIRARPRPDGRIERADAVTGGPGGQRVLVVDDLDEMRTLIHRALSARGYKVDVAANLAEAREKQPRGYDAVLVDAHLGAERGIDLVEALQSEEIGRASCR